MTNNAALTDKHSRTVTSLKQHVAALSRTMADDVLSYDKYLRAMTRLQQHVVRLSCYTEGLAEAVLPNWGMQQAGDAALKDTYSRAVASLEQRVAALSRTMADDAASIKDKGSCAVAAMEQHLATFLRYYELLVADVRKVNQPRADWTMERVVELQRMFERNCRLEAQRARGHRMVVDSKQAPTHKAKDPRVAKLEGEVAVLKRNNEQLIKLQRKYETEAKEAAAREQALTHKVATLMAAHKSEVESLKATHKSEVANIRSVHCQNLDDFNSFRRSSKEATDKLVKELADAKAEAVRHDEVNRSLRKEKDAIESGVMTALGMLDILELSMFGKPVEVPAPTQQDEALVALQEQRPSGVSSNCYSPSTVSPRTSTKTMAKPATVKEVVKAVKVPAPTLQGRMRKMELEMIEKKEKIKWLLEKTRMLSEKSSSSSSPSTVSPSSATRATPATLLKVPAQTQQRPVRKQELTLPKETKRAPAMAASRWTYYKNEQSGPSPVGTSSTSSSPEISPRSAASWSTKDVDSCVADAA